MKQGKFGLKKEVLSFKNFTVIIMIKAFNTIKDKNIIHRSWYIDQRFELRDGECFGDDSWSD